MFLAIQAIRMVRFPYNNTAPQFLPGDIMDYELRDFRKTYNKAVLPPRLESIRIDIHVAHLPLGIIRGPHKEQMILSAIHHEHIV